MSEIISTGIERHYGVENPAEGLPSYGVAPIEVEVKSLPQTPDAKELSPQSALIKTPETTPQIDNIWDGRGYTPSQIDGSVSDGISSGDRARDIVAQKIAQVPVTN